MADPSRRRWSARARIVGWLVCLVSVILAVNLLVATRVLQARAVERVGDEIAHEYDKLATFVAQSAPQPPRVDALLTAYLATALPDESETYFTVVDGVADRRSGNAPPYRLDDDPEFVALASATTEPRVGSWTAGGNQMRYGVFPVAVPGDDRPAAFVVVEFVDDDVTRSTVALLAAVGLGALAVAGAVSWFVAGRLLRPIQAISDTAERISESDLTRRIDVQGNDDVADLARTFNRMLDRIEAAMDGQRRFLDDVSHELRTPLTVVRGQFELMGDDPAERQRVTPLVLGELDRMGRLVDDLLLLARAERPDFLTRTAVDLADLTVEAVAKSRTLGERRWSMSEVAAETIVVDGQRITQALMQLVANAVVHTEPGAEIDVGSAVRGGHVEIWVRDAGRGIAPRDHQRIFERFGSVHGDSSGLGLAIVRSIAEAHGGEIGVHSELGAGSTFTLRLPATCIVPADHDDGQEDADPGDEILGAGPGGLDDGLKPVAERADIVDGAATPRGAMSGPGATWPTS